MTSPSARAFPHPLLSETPERRFQGAGSPVPSRSQRAKRSRAMNIGEYADGKAQQPLSPILKPHEADIGGFSGLCNKLCMKILRLLAVGLKVRVSSEI